MESIALLRLDRLTAFMAGSDAAPDVLDARVTSFEAVYEAHYRDVSRHVILTTGGRDDTEEIVAETFARAFAAWRSGHGPAGRPLPWLLVIARRISTDRWRRRRIIAWLPLSGSGRSNANDWDRRGGFGIKEGASVTTPSSVYLGFGFEGISGAATRAEVIDRIVDYLLN